MDAARAAVHEYRALRRLDDIGIDVEPRQRRRAVLFEDRAGSMPWSTSNDTSRWPSLNIVTIMSPTCFRLIAGAWNTVGKRMKISLTRLNGFAAHDDETEAQA
ncbi:hypothetical protein [Burkholderia perseverans]|uniref:hypothetical protein n=1 Tax=Burkholderia perseverans TaxID=2615214 RepID=UPI001FEFF40D|nr:hypothetical protein [Burkholderia perseverans]